MENKKYYTWRVTYMTDYPYSSRMDVPGTDEADAWKGFENRVGFKRNEFWPEMLLEM